jgi:acyl-coenzyme A synthetase/AMP-(fatty) acid ligase
VTRSPPIRATFSGGTKRLSWCRERIAGFERPRAYAFIDDEQMPRTATGKIQHRRLRERLLATVQAA